MKTSRGFVLAAVLLGFFAVVGCQPIEYPPTPNTNLDVCVRNPECTNTIAVGHRGTGSFNLLAPENTLGAYDMAWRMGADSIEVDPRDTLDGVPIIMHDDTVDRMTDGTGSVAEMTLGQIKALNVPSINPAVPTQQVPTFAEALALLREKTLVYIDIKSADVPGLVRVIEEQGMLNAAYLLIGSIDEGLQARTQNPTVALMPKIYTEADVLAYIDALSPILMFEIEYADATPEVVSLIHSYNIKIHMDALWVYDAAGINGYTTLEDRGTDSIQTDRLEVLVPFVRGLTDR